MEQLLQFVQDFGTYLSGNVFDSAFIFLGTLLVSILGFGVNRLGATEWGRQVQMVWALIDQHVFDVAISIATTERYSNSEGISIANEYSERFPDATPLDPRLAFVVKAAELQIEQHVQIDFDFLYVVSRVEAIYQLRVRGL